MTDPDPDRVAAAVDDIEAARASVIRAVVDFVERLRRAGVAVPGDGAVVATEALAEVGYGDRETVRAATKAALVSREADVETFERLFERFWRDLDASGPEEPVDVDFLPEAADPTVEDAADADAETSRSDDERDTGDRDDPDPDGAGTVRVGGSPRDDAPGDGAVEVARYSPAGGSEPVERRPGSGRYALAGPVARLTSALATLPGRRHERAGAGRFVDARRALRSSFETGGIVASLPERDRADSAVRGTVLVDVSQSVLDSVDRGFLLEWLRLLAREWRSLRAFFFDTDLREVTDAFDERSVRGVSEALARAEAAWGGGTRIGEAFATVRRSYPDAVDRRTVVFVVSDGLERGDVGQLATGAAWLSRRADLLLWLNPLAASPAYEPTARGMAAALPAVDGLFAFAGPADVAELARQLDRHDRARLGYEYDPRN